MDHALCQDLSQKRPNVRDTFFPNSVSTVLAKGNTYSKLYILLMWSNFIMWLSFPHRPPRNPCLANSNFFVLELLCSQLLRYWLKLPVLNYLAGFPPCLPCRSCIYHFSATFACKSTRCSSCTAQIVIHQV